MMMRKDTKDFLEWRAKVYPNLPPPKMPRQMRPKEFAAAPLDDVAWWPAPIREVMATLMGALRSLRRAKIDYKRARTTAFVVHEFVHAYVSVRDEAHAAAEAQDLAGVEDQRPIITAEQIRAAEKKILQAGGIRGIEEERCLGVISSR